MHPRNPQIISLTNKEMTTQARRNPSDDPLANIYLQHMDLIYRLFNMNFAKCSPVINNSIDVYVGVRGLKSYLYYPLTILPFHWSKNKDGILMKVTMYNDY